MANLDSTTKQCTRCEKELPATREFFYADRRGKYGLFAYCKDCHKEFQRSFRKTEQGRAVKARSFARQKARFPERTKAVKAVSNAVRDGKLLSAKFLLCVVCGYNAKQYHHHSYLPEYWLDVVPVCEECHRKLHREGIAL